MNINFKGEHIGNLDEFKVHPLGFFYFSADIDLKTKARLHVWPSAECVDEGQEEQIHRHSFDLYSIVMKGKLLNRLFKFEENQSGQLFELEVKYSGGNSEISSNGVRGDIEECGSFNVSEGCRYFLKSGIIHCAVPVIFPCVTFLKTIATDNYDISFGDKSGSKSFKRRGIAPHEINIIRNILGEWRNENGVDIGNYFE